VLARCPSCRNTFRAERTGLQDCPVCGKPLIVPSGPPKGPGEQEGETASTASALPPIDEPTPRAPGTPWERRDELGLWTAWSKTVVQALLEPGKLYASARLDRGPAQLGFAVATASIFLSIGQILDHLLFVRQREQLQLFLQQLSDNPSYPPWLQKFVESSIRHSLADTLLWSLLTPVFVFVFLYASAGLTHLCALLFGQNRRGFSATFASTAYAFAPLVLVVVPGCGGIIGLVWCAVLTGIGLKVTHGISNGGATAAAIGPYALFCCGGCALLVAVAIVARAFQGAG
jgi:hypothetical protein